MNGDLYGVNSVPDFIPGFDGPPAAKAGDADPGERDRRDELLNDDEHEHGADDPGDIYYGLGVCPSCKRADEYRNIYREHWFFCRAHRVRWCPGSNLLSDWREENEDKWRANAEFLAFYRVIEPDYGPEHARQQGQT